MTTSTRYFHLTRAFDLHSHCTLQFHSHANRTSHMYSLSSIYWFKSFGSCRDIEQRYTLQSPSSSSMSMSLSGDTPSSRRCRHWHTQLLLIKINRENGRAHSVNACHLNWVRSAPGNDILDWHLHLVLFDASFESEKMHTIQSRIVAATCCRATQHTIGLSGLRRNAELS